MSRLSWIVIPALLWGATLAFAFLDQRPEGVAVAFTGQMDGYLTPCGCTKPMIGGVPRRANYLQTLDKDLIKVENGDLTKASGRQDELKAETAVEIFNLMSYDAINLGERDFALGMDYLRSLEARFKGKLLCANAKDENGKALFPDRIVADREVSGKKVKVVVFGLLSESFAGEVAAVNPSVIIEPAEDALERMASRIQSAGVVRILLYHGPKAEAEALLQKFPYFQLVITAHDSDDPSGPWKVEKALIVSPGKDGKHVGLASLSSKDNWKASQSEMKDLWPDVGENDEVRSALAIYGERVGAEGLLAQVPKTTSPIGDTFAGTEACIGCHAEAAKVWQSSRHSKAMSTLVEEKHDKDPECVGCHVVGLTTVGGFVSHKETPHLENVGCESCHGPLAKHAANPSQRPAKVGEASCGQCHIPEHSPKFEFKNYWEKIKH